MSDASEPDFDEFVVTGPLFTVAARGSIPTAEPGSVADAPLEIHLYHGKRGVYACLFTDKDLAKRYVANTPGDLAVLEFADRGSVRAFLVQAERTGAVRVAVDLPRAAGRQFRAFPIRRFIDSIPE